MVELVAFAFEEHLVRTVKRDGLPWFVGRDVCGALGIRNESDALSVLDADERAEVGIADPSGAKIAIIVSEPGVYRLVFRSRKPEAERFKRWLAHEVLPAIRRTGKYAAGSPDYASPTPADAAAESMVQRLGVIREARVLFGPARARSLWRKLGMPDVPPPPSGPADEANACLRHLLEAEVYSGGASVREAIARALDDDEEARALLLACGVKVLVDRDVFVVANGHAGLKRIFAGSSWDGPLGHVRVLRRLAGACYGGKHRYGGLVLNGTELPGELLDEL